MKTMIYMCFYDFLLKKCFSYRHLVDVLLKRLMLTRISNLLSNVLRHTK